MEFRIRLEHYFRTKHFNLNMRNYLTRNMSEELILIGLDSMIHAKTQTHSVAAPETLPLGEQEFRQWA